MMRTLLFAVVMAMSVAAPLAAAERGAVTNLPLPRFVSLKAAEGYVRRGPSGTHRVDWVFKRRNMPLQIIAEYGHWRRVVDRDGAGGWMHYSLLSGARTVLITRDLLPIYDKPSTASRVAAYSEDGVIAKLGECAGGWCEVSVGSADGWAEAQALWGVTEEEDIPITPGGS
jgi:SH3-like domain-containing protein